MGWFGINILLPVVAPLLLLWIVRTSFNLPEPYASRAQLIRVVQDGQLGWVALVFSASCSYDLFSHFQRHQADTPDWAGLVLGVSIILAIIACILATLGSLFPVAEPADKFTRISAWARHYRLLCATTLATVVTGTLLTIVHFSL